MDVSKSDVSHSDSRLSIAFLEKRVKHAAWASAIRLVLLLRTNVDVPPDRLNDFHVLIEDVFDDTVTVISRISLHID